MSKASVFFVCEPYENFVKESIEGLQKGARWLYKRKMKVQEGLYTVSIISTRGFIEHFYKGG